MKLLIVITITVIQIDRILCNDNDIFSSTTELEKLYHRNPFLNTFSAISAELWNAQRNVERQTV